MQKPTARIRWRETSVIRVLCHRAWSRRLRARLGAGTVAIFATIALGMAWGPGSAQALSKVIETHMPEIVQWVYRNGAVETSHTCEATCAELWSDETGVPPSARALETLHNLESSLPLWGTQTELKNAFDASWKYLGSTPLRVGWWIVNGSMPAASKWVELEGPVSPNCGTETDKVTLRDPGEEIGSTFYEHPYSSGEEVYLICPGAIGEIAAQQIREPTSGACHETAGLPTFGGFIRQEWWWNKCGEGEGVFAKVFAAAYHAPLRIARVEDWKGQHLEGEGNNIQTYGGEDPGITAVTAATKGALAAGPGLTEYIEWILEGKHGPNPAGVVPEEAFGSGNGATPNAELCLKAHPVDCATGNQTESQQDLTVGGRGPTLELARTYNSQAAVKESSPGPFGYGWSSSYSAHIELNAERGSATVHNDNGSTVRFASTGSAWTPVSPLVEATLSAEGTGFLYTLPNQTALHFNSSGQLTSESDRNGNTLTMARGGGGRLESVADGSGRKLVFAYNAGGQVESVKDPMGHLVQYAYEGGNLVSVTEPGEASARWQFKYDASHELTKETDGRGHAVSSEYDAEHRVVFQSDALERQYKWSYEGTALAPQTTITEPNGSKTVEQFNQWEQPTSVTRAFGTAIASTTASSYDSFGRLQRRTDPDGKTTTYGYDAAGNLTGRVDALGDSATWAYNATHDVVSETTPNGETTTIERDAHGNAIKVSRPAPGSKTQVSEYKYAANGDLESATNPLGYTTKYEYDSHGDRSAETDPEGDKQTWGYSENSQVLSSVSPRGHVVGAKESSFTTSVERDARGRVIKVTDPLKHVTKYTYDANGNLESKTDPLLSVTVYTYDFDDEPTKIKEPNGTTTETEYDSQGHVIAQTDGNKHTTKYVRNLLGEVAEVVDPLGRKTLKEHDAAGNLTKLTDAAKRTTTYKYDPANRLTEVSYSDGKTPTVQYEYDADGNRTKMIDGTGTSKYTHDQLDRLTETKDGHGDVIGYEYDLANEQTKITYPSGKSVSRGYDKAGRLESVTDWLGHTSKFAYDADSDLTSTTFPASTSDVDQYAYEANDAMEVITMKKGAETLASLEYTRNKDAQVVKATTNGLPGEEKPAFTYDENSRLTKGAGIKYGYDAANDPTTIGGETYAYDGANELEKRVLGKSTVATYGYDEVGERTKTTPASGSATTYGYDQAGNLKLVERAAEGQKAAIKDAYAYDGDGLRASQTIAGSTSYMNWDAAEALPLLLNDETSSFIYGPGGLPIEQVAGETVQYLHHDQQGSTRLLTGAAGTTLGTTTFDAYGNKLGSTGSATSALGYDGQYTSPDTGLIYLRARVYDPASAQFLSRDPLQVVSREPYGYAAQDPMNREDGPGLIWAPVAGGAGGADAACGATFELPGVDIGTCGAAGIETGAAAVGAAIGIVTEFAGEESGDEGEAENRKKEAEREKCGDPTESPSPRFEWVGKGEKGSDDGQWLDPDTGEYLRPDFKDSSHGPHYDYRTPGGDRYRIYPDGRFEPK